MDSLTHLIAGALVPPAFARAPRRAGLIAFGILAGELPDIDVLLGGASSPVALFTIHRGITHALLSQPALAAALVLPFFCFFQAKAPERSPSLKSLFVMALAALLLHLYLDCMTTFGTQIFLPFSAYRVALPAMFIVDLFCTIPAACLLAVALIAPAEPGPEFSARARRFARLGLCWLLLYPLCALGINALVHIKESTGMASNERLITLTEPFSPFVWKRVIEDGAVVRVSTDFLWEPLERETEARFARALLLPTVAEAEPLAAMFATFAGPCVQVEHPAGPDGSRLVDFIGVRYLISPQSAAHLIGRSDPNFVLQARLTPDNRVLALRFFNRGRDLPLR